MKKLLVLALSLVFVLSLTACGENNTNGGASSNNNSDSLISDIMPDTSSNNNVNPDMNNSGDMSLDNSNTTDTKIAKDKALEMAFKVAGVKEQDAKDIDIELDRENGEAVWDIDFESGNTEYSYEINADTGDILKQDKEPRD